MKQRKQTYRELAKEFKTSRSEKSFTALYHKMSPGLRKYIFKIVKDADVTEDLLSMTFTKIYTKIDTYDESWQITTWAYKIAYNECMGHFRTRNKREVVLNSSSDDDDYSSFSETLLSKVDDSISMQEYLEREELLDTRYNLTIDAINALPPMYKPYMVECFINNKQYKDIADLMSKYERGVSIQTVKNRIFRGRRILRAQLANFPAFS